MDFHSTIMGFGFGAVAGTIAANLIGVSYLQTPFFMLGGIFGAVLCSGAFGSIDIMETMFN